MTAPLPGMEDVNAPAGLKGWDLAFWRVRNKPARLAVLAALRALSGGRAEMFACNVTILREVNKTRTMALRSLVMNMTGLEHDERLIDRTPSREAKSNRRIRFTFDVSDASVNCRGGASYLRPPAQVTCAPSRKLLAPPRASYLRPPLPLVPEPQGVTEPPPAPLNSDSESMTSNSRVNADACARERGTETQGEADSVADLVQLAASSSKRTREIYRAKLAALGLGPDGSPLGGSAPTEPPVMPPAPAVPASPAPAAASAPAFDGAWARLMARAKPEQAPPPPTAPATRRDEPPARAAADPSALARQLGAGPAAASRLAEDLGRRWRDRKPETLAFWASGLAEVSTGLLTADLVVGLIRDADRPGVRSRSREFSASLGKALVAARRAKNRPGCGLRSFTPAGAGKPTSPTTRDYTLNRGPCNARVAGS